MEHNEELKSAITRELSNMSYTAQGVLNREWLAKEVFKQPEKLKKLNSIVHPAVVADFERWAEQQEDALYVIVETAILFEAKLDQSVDITVAVLAPEELRVQRVVMRDGLSVEQVRARIAAQLSDEELNQRCNYTVVNIIEGEMGDAAQRLDQIFKHEASKARS